MANEIVKVHNDLTNEKLGKMNAKELDLFMCICHKMRDKGTCEVAISFDELRKLGNYNENSNERMKKLLVDANKKLLSFVIQIDKGDDTYQKVLFKEFRTNSVKGVVFVEVWEDLAYILNGIANNFTRFELSEFVSLESKYAKRLYKLLKQYRTQGIYYTSKSDFYRDLNVPDTYTNTNFNKKVLRPAVEECKKYMPKLECIPKKSGRGGAVRGYTFIFDREIPELAVKSNSKGKTKTKGNRNTFNEFEQTKIDFDELEKNILSN